MKILTYSFYEKSGFLISSLLIFFPSSTYSFFSSFSPHYQLLQEKIMAKSIALQQELLKAELKVSFIVHINKNLGIQPLSSFH